MNNQKTVDELVKISICNWCSTVREDEKEFCYIDGCNRAKETKQEIVNMLKGFEKECDKITFTKGLRLGIDYISFKQKIQELIGGVR